LIQQKQSRNEIQKIALALISEQRFQAAEEEREEAVKAASK
jgi:hypothetical protein